MDTIYNAQTIYTEMKLSVHVYLIDIIFDRGTLPFSGKKCLHNQVPLNQCFRIYKYRFKIY